MERRVWRGGWGEVEPIATGLGHTLSLARFKKGNHLSKSALEKSFWEQHGEWIGSGLSGGRKPGEEAEVDAMRQVGDDGGP